MSSDPFDADDALFDDPATLEAIAKIEQQVIASQAIKPTAGPSKRATSSYHHTVAQPRSSPRNKPISRLSTNAPRVPKPPIPTGKQPQPSALPPPAAPSLRRPPPKVQTEPRVAAQTFGFGENGKFGLPDIQERAAAYSASKPSIYPNASQEVNHEAARDKEQEEEDEPMDIVMDEAGRYGFGVEANEIIDGRAHPEIRSMVQNANRAGPSQITSTRPFVPPSRTTSRAPSAPPLITAPTSRPAPPPNVPAPPSSLGTRQFGRSMSAGSQVFSRPTSTSGPSRAPALAAIPSQGSQGSSSGAPPASQGAASRRAAFELETQKQLVERLQAEVDELRKAQERNSQPEWRMEVKGFVDDVPDREHKEEVKALKEKLWTAQGEVTNARRAQKDEHTKHAAEIEKLRKENEHLEAQVKLREVDARLKVESVKTQAVFSHHNILTSATKSRQASQRPGAASQRPPASPFRTGSPAREYESVTPAPAPPLRTAPVRFDGLHNAFNVTPQLGSRVKRQRTEAPSPSNSPSRPVSASPFKSSPSKGVKAEGSSPAFGPEEGDVDMDWGGLDDDVVPKEPATEERDVRSEFAYHLLHHSYAYPFVSQNDQPTILRIITHRRVPLPLEPTDPANPGEEWHRRCDEFNHEYQAMSGTIVALCGDTSVPYQRLAGTVLDLLTKMMEVVVGDVDQRRQRREESGDDGFFRSVTIIPHFTSLLSSLLNLFPDSFTFDPDLGNRLTSLLLLLTQMVPLSRTSPRAEQLGSGEELGNGPEWERVYEARASGELVRVCTSADRRQGDGEGGGDKDGSRIEAGDGEGGDGFGDWSKSLISLAEAICRHGDGTVCWPEDRLVEFILRWTAQCHNPTIFKSACDLFYTAACRRDYFRVLTTKAPIFQSDVPVIDWLSRFLVHPPRWTGPFATSAAAQSLTSILSGTLMLSLTDEDAVILIAERSGLVPGLLFTLERESRKIWGMDAVEGSKESVLNLLTLALVVLHHLVYPPPLPGRTWTHPHSQHPPLSQLHSQALVSQASPSALGPNSTTTGGVAPALDGPQRQGVDIARKLQDLGNGTNKEFAGIHHVFYTAVGVMAYGDVEEWKEGRVGTGAEVGKGRGEWVLDLRTVQFLAQDILEAVVEGPEGDQIYEIYVEDESGGIEEDADLGPSVHEDEGEDEEEQAAAEVGMEVDEQMDEAYFELVDSSPD